MIYRPVRERSPQEIMELAEEAIGRSGFDELALLSLSTGDYSCLPELLTALMDRFADEYVSVSMPSMRVGTLTPEIMEQIKRVRKTGFTVAPEAGSERLRQVINKGISEEDLLTTCRAAFTLGWKLIKMYFMIGLPTETKEDVDDIAELAKKARQEAGERKGQVRINVSVGTFVPKPHTPFQRTAQLSLEQSVERINLLKKTLPRKGFNLKWHDPRMSFLEGVFSRGDRRLAELIECVWQEGGRLDGWSEEFDLKRWQKAAELLGIDLESYLRERDATETLPWGHLHCGVDDDFLAAEYENAINREYTPDCRIHGCQQCGLCDFKRIKPHTNRQVDIEKWRSLAAGRLAVQERVQTDNQTRFRYRVQYRRLGDSRFLGHLEVLQLVFRALRRARIPVLFSQGFNPSPRISFSPALPVGVESDVEYFDMDLSQPLSSSEDCAAALNAQLVLGLVVTEVTHVPKKKLHNLLVHYRVEQMEVEMQVLQERLRTFLAADSWPVVRMRKGKRRELDIRAMVRQVALEDGILELVLLSQEGKASIGPKDVLRHVFGLGEREVLLTRIRKVALEEATQVVE
jgi:radical SAM-linked protein